MPHLEADTGEITHSVAAATEPGDQHLLLHASQGEPPLSPACQL